MSDMHYTFIREKLFRRYTMKYNIYFFFIDKTVSDNISNRTNLKLLVLVLKIVINNLFLD